MIVAPDFEHPAAATHGSCDTIGFDRVAITVLPGIDIAQVVFSVKKGGDDRYRPFYPSG
jgi:hypothetical protein